MQMILLFTLDLSLNSPFAPQDPRPEQPFGQYAQVFAMRVTKIAKVKCTKMFMIEA